MGLFEIASRLIGKSPNTVRSAYNQARQMIGGANPHNASEALSILENKGVSGDFVNNAISKIVPLAKTAKFFGVKELRNVNIDEIADKAKAAMGNTGTYQSPYPKMNRRDKQYLSSNLPD